MESSIIILVTAALAGMCVLIYQQICIEYQGKIEAAVNSLYIRHLDIYNDQIIAWHYTIKELRLEKASDDLIQYAFKKLNEERKKRIVHGKVISGGRVIQVNRIN